MERLKIIAMGLSFILLAGSFQAALPAEVIRAGSIFALSDAGIFIAFVSIKQRYPGHARQAGHVAAGCHSNAYCGRYTIVVDDDIDPTDTDQVLWALATRSDPQNSIDIVKRCWSTPLDPMIRKGEPPLNSRAIIEACRPFEWIKEFPPVVAFSQEEIEAAKEKWGHLIFD